MKVTLKGLYKRPMKLADGSTKTYFYAWRGGPRLLSEPNTPDFIAEFQAAKDSLRELPRGTIAWLIQDFKKSQDWQDLKDRTKRDHEEMFVKIKHEFGTTTLSRAEAHGSRKAFKAWRDHLGKSSHKTADKAISSLSRLFTHAIDQEVMQRNPVKGLGKLYKSNRADKWWRTEQIKAFRSTASPQLRLALKMALDTGQRQGDLLDLNWSDYNGTHISLTQNKTGKKVSILASDELKAMLDAQPKTSTKILVNGKGIPWTPLGFSASWRKAAAKAGLKDLTFHDLRGTFVMQCLQADMKIEDIRLVTGHSLSGLRTLEKHYMGWDSDAADNVILALQQNRKGTKL